MRKRAVVALVSVLSLGIFAYAKNPESVRQFFKPIPKNERIVQALNRLTFGPRPGDVEQVRKTGLKKWIEQQLHPDSIPENPALAAKLRQMDTLTMSSADLVRNYPTPQMVKQMVAGQLPFPKDPDRRMLIEKLVARYEQKQGAGATPDPDAPNRQPLRDVLSQDQVRIIRTDEELMIARSVSRLLHLGSKRKRRP